MRGVLIGCADLLPGISGATLALLTGVYERILDVLYACDVRLFRLLLRGSLTAFFKRLQIGFLLALLLGVLSSLLLLARSMNWLKSTYPVFFWAFLLGLVLATAYRMIRDLPLLQRPRLWIGLAVGVIAATLLLSLPNLQSTTSPSLLIVVAVAAVAICATLLPGISGSSVLLLLGHYELLLKGLASLDIRVLLSFGLGAVLGLLVFGRLVRLLWKRYPRPVFSCLSGLVLGSVPRLWPWRKDEEMLFPSAYAEITSSSAQTIWAVVAAGMGAVLVLWLAPKRIFNE